MNLDDFRTLTERLNGERELLCAGAPVNILSHDEGVHVSIDDGEPNLPADATLLYGDGDEKDVSRLAWC